MVAQIEISNQRGLKQGNPMVPFLFLLKAEGVSGLVNIVVKLDIWL